MKRIISLALVLLMVFTVSAVSFSALDSPKGKDYYNIETESKGGGEADSDKSKVNKESTGDDGDVTLTATENSGYFTRWDITGKYDIISGDLTSPILVIRPHSDIDAVAYFRVDKDNYTINVDVIGDGKANAEPVKVGINSDGTVTLTATDGNDKFATWILDGLYEIVEGSLTSRTLVIKPLSDVDAVAKFTSDGKDDGSGTGTTDKSTSPKTGDPTPYAVALIVLAAFGAMFAVKKIKE